MRYDYDNLDLLSEQQPHLLVEKYAELQKQDSDPSDLRIKCYYAKALISLTRFSEANKLVQSILQDAVLADDSFSMVWGNIILSKVYKNSENAFQEKPCLELAEDFALKSGSLDLIIEAQSHLGIFYSDHGNNKVAIDYLKHVEALAKKCTPGLTAINALLRCASFMHKQQDHAHVVVLLKKGLDLAIKAGIVSLQLQIINNHSSTYSQLKRFKESEDLLCRGYEVAVQHDLKSSQLKLLFNLGVQSNRQSKYSEAIAYYDRCQALAIEIGMNKPDFWLDLYCNYACCFWLFGDPLSSMEYLNKAEKLLENYETHPKKMWIAVNKTNVLIAEAKFSEAKGILQTAIRYYHKEKDIANLLIVYRNLALLYEKSNNLKLSIRTFKVIDELHVKHMEQTLIGKSEGYQLKLNEPQDNDPHSIAKSISEAGKTHPDEALHFIGISEATKKVIRSALLASQHPDANVFITGESGTGKEVIARFIHQNSIRKNNPFVAVNCSAISHSLLESEMFGHRKGAFTGAFETTKGVFVAAHRGTLFLDEITEMSIEMQPKLLRAIESRVVVPVGGNQEIPFDCRIISATNRDIISLLHNDTLRLDIFHRLNTIQINIPPLRERTEDLPLLLDYYIAQYCMANRLDAPRIPRAFVEKLRTYSFPGNVRELINIVNRMFILYPQQEWEPAFLENNDIIAQAMHPHSKRLDISQDEERQMIIKALLQCNGHQKKAALSLGLNESTLTRRIQKFNLQGYTKRS